MPALCWPNARAEDDTAQTTSPVACNLQAPHSPLRTAVLSGQRKWGGGSPPPPEVGHLNAITDIRRTQSNRILTR